MSSVEALPILLKQLKLKCFSMKWPEVEKVANEKSWRHAKYLAILCELEANQRLENKIQRMIKASKLPVGKTLSCFDFKAALSVPKATIEALAENNTWIQQGNNVILFGPSGVGKTHLAAAIGYRLIEQGSRVLFESTTSLVQKLQAARQQYKLPDTLLKLSRYDLLILDDIGYVKKDDAETSVLFELIADRYENKSLLITANQPFGEWDKIFPDNMMAVAAIDRLVHHATIINIEEESYRQEAARIQQGRDKKSTTGKDN
jgi:DNA replication protein DnaC